MRFRSSDAEQVGTIAWVAELYRLSRVASAGDDLHEALQSMLGHIAEGFAAASGSLAIVPPDAADELEIVAGVDLPAGTVGSRIAFGEDVLGRVAQAGRPLLIQGALAADAHPRSVERASSMCWPLRVKERVIGTLAVNRGPDMPPYGESDLEHGAVMANIVALVVDNSRLHIEQQQRIAALSRINAELVEAGRRLQETQAQLMQSEKMASIGQLAAGVAHEINNPVGYVYSNMGSLERYVQTLLAVIDAYAAGGAGRADAELQRVLRESELDFLRDDVVALLAESREGLDRVRKIVQDLKDFSRVDASDDWQFANVNDGLTSTLNIVHNELKYKSVVDRQLGELPEIECLPSQLNQVFLNLLVNAGQAIERDGRIRIATGVEGDSVWIDVEDNGCGIPADKLTRIFEPFYTTKAVGKGTGLGLSLSYSIVQKHHGRIEVASQVGRGTRFRVVLPQRQPADAR